MAAPPDRKEEAAVRAPQACAGVSTSTLDPFMGSFGARLDDFLLFHRKRNLREARDQGHIKGDNFFCRWCFADWKDAVTFATVFGGDITSTTPACNDSRNSLKHYRNQCAA